MRVSITVLWILTILSHIVAAVQGSSQLTHNFENIYFYYGYLVDVALNGDSRTFGYRRTPSSGTNCPFWEFIYSIEDEFTAAMLLPDEELGGPPGLGICKRSPLP